MPNITDEETYKIINRNLPDIDDLVIKVNYLSPDIISTKFQPDSNFPVAAACLQDTLRTLTEARYALLESFAHKYWYLKISKPIDESKAIFFGRFFADDTALRLYSSAEHLAKAIVNMLDISDDDIKEYRKGEGTRFIAVKIILVKNYPNHPITLAVDQLYNSSEWKTTVDYRNAWVHNQPPIIDGSGMIFKRERRWKTSSDGKRYMLGLGIGDEARYSIDDLQGFLKLTLCQFSNIFGIVVEFYIKELERRGITFGEHGLQT